MHIEGKCHAIINLFNIMKPSLEFHPPTPTYWPDFFICHTEKKSHVSMYSSRLASILTVKICKYKCEGFRGGKDKRRGPKFFSKTVKLIVGKILTNFPKFESQEQEDTRVSSIHNSKSVFKKINITERSFYCI